MKTVYLAGPIAGQSYEDARFGWRKDFQEAWMEHKMIPYMFGRLVSPMRGKDFLSGADKIGHQPGEYKDPFGRDAGIVARDMNDVRNCYCMVAHFLGATEISRGTMVEYGWASAFGKPIITIIEEDGKVLSEGFGYERMNPHWYCMVRQLSGYIVHDIQTAVDVAAHLVGEGL